eukprot:scaffold8204_cov177-Amphora_coffeaeformis.AAC.10
MGRQRQSLSWKESPLMFPSWTRCCRPPSDCMVFVFVELLRCGGYLRCLDSEIWIPTGNPAPLPKRVAYSDGSHDIITALPIRKEVAASV